MQLEYLKTANSMLVWIGCIPGVALVLIQAYMFMMRAWKTGPKMGVPVEKMKEAAKSSLIASIGPSIVVVSGMFSLLASIGGPLSWMRLAYIGSVMYELPTAERAAMFCGCQLGTDNMTQDAFATAAWMMTIGCLGWILISALFTDKMEMLRDKIAGGNMDAIQALTAGGGVGGFAYMVAQRCIPFNPMSSNLWAVVASAVFTVWLNTYMKKNPTAKWAQQFGMTISMFFGMAVGAIAIFIA